MHEIKTHIKPDGSLDLPKEVVQKLKNKEIRIITEEKDYEKKSNNRSFWELLKNGPKAKGYGDKITREFIHKRK